MSADLAAFLLARIAEDEAAAREAAEEVDRLNDAFEVENPKWRVWSRPFASVTSSGPVAEFVDRQTPARVLAECEAKRRIVKTVARNPNAPWDAYAIGRDDVGRSVLRLLALPFADHPDFDPSWRP